MIFFRKFVDMQKKTLKEEFEYLKFPRLSEKEEKLFELYLNERSVLFLRFIAFLFILTDISIYYVLDYYAAPQTYKIIWFIRTVFILIPSVITFWLTYRPIIFKKFQQIAFAHNILSNLGVLLMIYVSKISEPAYSTYFVGYLLIMTTTVTARLRFKPALIDFSIVTFIFLVIIIFRQHLLDTEQGFVMFVNEMIFTISFLIALISGHFVLENFSRRVFLHEREVERKNLELEEKNIEISTQKQEILEQKQIIESRHHQIIQSINYGMNIQKAILPSEKILKLLFEDFFVLYLPKETVSGDFYYAKKIHKYIVFAVADCTGHGVPGGFVTMLSYTFLDEVLRMSSVSDTAQTLEIVRERMLNVFGKDSYNHDGMDIALCAINEETDELMFSGAYNSIIIASEDKIAEYKGVRSPIGFHPRKLHYKTDFIKLQKNDVVYLFSDGISDMRSRDDLKFGKKRLKKFIEENHYKNLQEQKSILQKKINQWLSGYPAVDDITIMAVKWK
jgi:serine phosphatase RsbU (regulator of sigma subunit)